MKHCRVANKTKTDQDRQRSDRFAYSAYKSRDSRIIKREINLSGAHFKDNTSPGKGRLMKAPNTKGYVFVSRAHLLYENRLIYAIVKFINLFYRKLSVVGPVEDRSPVCKSGWAFFPKTKLRGFVLIKVVARSKNRKGKRLEALEIN